MGAWSTFTAAEFQLSTKYRIPYFTLFLFTPEDLNVVAEDDPGEPYPHYSFVGFSTTVGRARQRLEEAGYDLAFFARVLESHLEGFQEEYISTLQESSPHRLDEAAVAQLARELHEVDFSPVIRSELPPLGQYLDFLRAVADGRRRRGLVRKMRALGAPEGTLRDDSLFSEDGELSRDQVWGLAFDASPFLPRAVVQTAYQMLSICDDYGDFYELFLAWIVLSLGDDGRVASIEFGDMVDPPDVEQKALQMLAEVRQDAIRKLNAYNSAFALIARLDPQLAERAQRQKIMSALSDATAEEDSNSKGNLLEECMSSLFALSDAFAIASRRLNLEDEELDIILHNNSQRPFFLGLQSPLVLLECKNWRDPVGVDELRNFEGKVRNHRNLCRVGLFFAVNGFTEPARDFLRRLGRDGPVIALLQMDQLRDFLADMMPLEEWLQRRIAESIA